MSSFIDPASIIAQSGIAANQTVADLGCGGGFYTVAAAKVVGNSGSVYAVDIQESKLAATQSAGRHLGVSNIMIAKADLEKPLTEIPENSCDAVLVTSILHEIGDKESLLRNAYRLLKTGGNLAVVEWKKEPTTFGPDMASRIAPQQLQHMLEGLGLRKVKDIDAGKFHYSMVFTK